MNVNVDVDVVLVEMWLLITRQFLPTGIATGFGSKDFLQAMLEPI